MITGLAEDLQKRKEKNNVRAVFSQSGLYPIPSQAKPFENFLYPRMDIR